MGIKTLLVIFISLSFSTGALAGSYKRKKTPTPAEEASIMPIMEENPDMSIKKEFMFSGDFAGSYSMFSSEEDPHGDFDMNLVQFNAKADMDQSYFSLGFGYGSTVRNLDPVGITNKLGLLYASYRMKTSYGLGFMLGRFESPVGHETYNHRMNSQFTKKLWI